jgi:hypothetical protein
MTRKASDILAGFLPPGPDVTAEVYATYVMDRLAELDWPELNLLCRFFQTDIGRLEGHVVRCKRDEAKQAALAAQKKGGVHVAQR